MTSLNRRVIVAVVGVTSLVVLVASLALWFVMQSMLMRSVDRELTNRVERMKRFEPLGSPEFWRSASTNDGRRRFLERGVSGDWRSLTQTIDLRDGGELFRSTALSVGLDLAPLAKPHEPIDVPRTQYLDDGSAVRLIAFKMHYSRNSFSRVDFRSETTPTAERPLDPPAPSRNEQNPTPEQKSSPEALVSVLTGVVPSSAIHAPGTPHQGVMIYFALGLEPVNGELSRMAVVLGVLWAAATLLAFGTILVLRPAVLRPTRDLAEAIAKLGPDDLTARVPVQQAPQEMRVVVDRLNGLFDRLEQAFKREQATIANIAHELRTPVAELRTALEFRQMTATGEDRAELDALLTTVVRMQTQVSNLLLLARLEAGKEPLQRSDADLGELVSEAVERWEDRAHTRGLDLSLGTFDRAPVATSPDHLGLVLDNLLSNSVAHATADGVISIAVTSTGDEVSFTITNPFTGNLDVQQLGHAYYRGDHARHGGDHTGLGLALCQRLCRLLDARLELTHGDGQFIARVVMKKRA